MAVNTYVAVGNKEDVSDIITMISPSETALTSRIGRAKATSTKHEWLEDDLRQPQKNAQTEGFTYFTNPADERERCDNYTQIFSDGVHTTKTQEVVEKYGVKSEIGYQMRNKLLELGLDVELAFLTQGAKVPGSMTVPREFGGLPYWIVSNDLANGGVLRPLTFDLINNALEQTYMNGGRPSILMVSARNKRVISTFTPNGKKYMRTEEKKLTEVIDVLETDFGTLRIVPNRIMQNDTVFFISPEYIKRAFLRPFKEEELPKISDMERKNYVGELTLEMRAEKAHAMIRDLDGIVPIAP